MSGLDLVGNFTDQYSLSQLKQYNLVWSMSGLVMAVLTLGILLVLVAAKTYRTPLQRLFLCLTLFTFFDLFFNSMNIMLQPQFYHQGVCKVVGYADVCIYITSMLLVFGIALYLLYVIYHHVQAKPLPVVNKHKMAALEVLFLLAVIGIPPLALLKNRDKFGISGPLCWIKTIDAQDGLVNQQFELDILSLYTAMITFNLSVFLLLMSISCLLACRQRHVRLHHVRMAKRASLLDLFLIVSFCINVVSLWAHYAGIDQKVPFPVLIVMALLVPSSPILIPVGFMLYLNSTKKLRLIKTAKKKLKRLFRRSSKSREMASPDGPSPDNPVCQVQEAPSYTVSREVGYTGAFTTVTSTYGSMDRTTYSE